MIGRDQSQLKTFVNNPKPSQNILLPGTPFLATTNTPEPGPTAPATTLLSGPRQYSINSIAVKIFCV